MHGLASIAGDRLGFHESPRKPTRFAVPTIRFPWSLAIAVGLLVAAAGPGLACPNCPQGMKSYAEHIAVADAVVLVEWVSGVKDTDEQVGSTTVRVRQVVKGPAKSLEGKSLKLDRYRGSKKGDLFLAFATERENGTGLEWNDVVEVNPVSFQYVLKAPPLEADAAKRLPYFLKFLESSDSLVANDAFAEFANAEYKDILELAPQLPREKLSRWIANPETQAVRLGLYATLLGMCGNNDDAEVLKTQILKKDAVGAYRLGLEGLISGYLMIQGDKGLDLIDAKLLRDKSVPFSETYAAAQAVRFMWTYSNKISHERLCRSMEGLLTRTEMADLVIADLARWKDWQIQDRLVKMYGQGDYNTPGIKRAIIRFLITCSKQPAGAGKQAETAQEQIQKARGHLDRIRQLDPKLVADAERYFLGS